MLKTKECTARAAVALLVCTAAAIAVYSSARGYAESPDVSLLENSEPPRGHVGFIATGNALDPSPLTKDIETFSAVSNVAAPSPSATPDESPTSDPRQIGSLY
jgi:hypothetical protein